MLGIVTVQASVRVAGRDAVLPMHTSVLLSDDPRYAVTWTEHESVGWHVVAGRELWRANDGEPQLAAGNMLIVSTGSRCFARRIADGTTAWSRDDCAHASAMRSTTTVFLRRGASAFDAVDVRTGRSELALSPPTGPLASIEALAISNDGEHIVGNSGSLWSWDAHGSRRLVDPPGGAAVVDLPVPAGRQARRGEHGSWRRAPVSL